MRARRPASLPCKPVLHGRAGAIACAAGLLLAAWQPVTAQPAGATAVHGQASVVTQGKRTQVTTVNGPGTNHSVIDWRSFHVPARTQTHFQQPGSGSTSINRVTGADPSTIFGKLTSNGHLVLVNPAGVAVGEKASVDTAGFTASTLNLSSEDAVAGRLRFEAGAAAAALQADGSIRVRGGDIVLLSSDVRVGETARLHATEGSIVLAAGQKVAVTGRGLEGITMELVAPGDRALNLGRLHGDAVGIFAAQLTHSGRIHADRIVLRDGLHLVSDGGSGGGGDDGAGNGRGGNGTNGNNGNNGNNGSGKGNGNGGGGGNGGGNGGNAGNGGIPGGGDDGSAGGNNGNNANAGMNRQQREAARRLLAETLFDAPGAGDDDRRRVVVSKRRLKTREDDDTNDTGKLGGPALCVR